MIQESTELRRFGLHDTIQQRIERFIIDSGARAGDPLPPQSDLARALGISVPSLREAMKSLEAVGVVEVRHGAGTYVGRFSLDAIVDGLAFRVRLETGEHARTLTELLDVRMELERLYVQRVVELADGEHVAALYEIVEQMERNAAAGITYAAEDSRFHVLLYRPINNRFLTALLLAFWEVFDLVKDELTVTPISESAIAAEHRHIVDALTARNANGAADAMQRHFRVIRARLSDVGTDG